MRRAAISPFMAFARHGWGIEQAIADPPDAHQAGHKCHHPPASVDFGNPPSRNRPADEVSEANIITGRIAHTFRPKRRVSGSRMV